MTLGVDMRAKKKTSAFRLALVAGAIATLGLVGLPATSASASSCWGSSCQGKDPSSTGCANGAITLLSRDVVTSGPGGGDWGVMDLRYSPSCWFQG